MLSAGSHSARSSRRTLIYILESAHARRKCDSIFEESSALPLQSTGSKNQQYPLTQPNKKSPIENRLFLVY
jgi:hypothetical protein